MIQPLWQDLGRLRSRRADALSFGNIEVDQDEASILLASLELLQAARSCSIPGSRNNSVVPVLKLIELQLASVHHSFSHESS